MRVKRASARSSSNVRARSSRTPSCAWTISSTTTRSSPSRRGWATRIVSSAAPATIFSGRCDAWASPRARSTFRSRGRSTIKPRASPRAATASSKRTAPTCSLARSLRSRERLRLFRDLALPRLRVLAGTDAGSLRRLLTRNEVCVRRKERKRLADEVAQRLELLIDHELHELFLDLVDHLVALQHRAGADLHRARSEQVELRRVEARLDAPDAADLDSGDRAR